MRRAASSPKKIPVFLWWAFFIFFLWVTIQLISQIKGSVFVSRPWRINIAFHTSPLSILSISPGSEEPLLVITLPETVYVNVPWGYGSYRLGAIWKLGEQEKRSSLFSETIEDSIGIKIHTVVGESEPRKINEVSDQLYNGLSRAFSYKELLFDRKLSSFNFLDRFILVWYFIKSRSSSALTYLSHQNNYLFADAKLPDGTEVKRINLDAFNTFLEQKFEDRRIREEAISVTVKNTTDISGVGQKFTQIITNLGGKVLTVGNEKNDISGCQLEVKPAASKARLVEYLIREYHCQKISLTTEGGTDVFVRVGKLFAERWKVADTALFLN